MLATEKRNREIAHSHWRVVYVCCCAKGPMCHGQPCIDPSSGGETTLTLRSKKTTSTSMQGSHTSLQNYILQTKKKNVERQSRINQPHKEDKLDHKSRQCICGCSSTLSTSHHAQAFKAAPHGPRCSVPGVSQHGRAIQGQLINLQFGFPDFF